MPWPRALPILLCASLLPTALLTTGCDGDDEGDDHHHADEVGHDESDESDETGGETGEPDLANGQTIHDGTCMVAGCHLDNGELLEELVPEHSDAQLLDIIGNGTELMPAQIQLSDEDIADVVAYARMLYG